MKTLHYIKNTRVKLILLLLMVLTVISSYSQDCAGNQIAITIKNITNPTPKSLEFDVYVTNTGDTSLSLASIQGAVLYDTRLIPQGATTQFSVIDDSHPTPSFANLNHLTTAHTSASNQLRWFQNPVALSSGKTANLPKNKSLKFARFRLESSMPLLTSFSSNLKPQLAVQRGYTNFLVTVYCNDSSNSTALFPKIKTDDLSDSNLSIIAIPNPFKDNFALKISSSSDSAIEIKVYNMLGKLIESKSVEANQIDAIILGANYASGIYNVKVSQNSSSQTLKLIKQ